MKRVLLVLSIALIASSAYSQGSYRLNYVNALFNYNGAVGQNGSPPLWEDSTVVLTSGTGSTSFSWWIHAIGSIFDPTTPLWDSLTNNVGLFVDTNSFIVDSVTVYYWYSRPVTSVTDTLRISIIPRSAMDPLVYQFNDWPQAGDTVRQVALCNYDYIGNKPSGAGITTIDYLLDDDDTATLLGSFTIPVNDTLWASGALGANIMSLSIQYFSGQTWNPGDTLVEQSGMYTVHNPLNAVQIPTYEELASSYPISPFDQPSFNEAMLVTREVRYNTSTGWNGRFIPAFAFVPGFLYEHVFMDWWVRPLGANFSYDVTGFDVDFTDLSSHLPDKWFWEFGDGDTSNLQDPSHTYAASGTYNVCLTATNTGTGDSYKVCKNVTLECNLTTNLNAPQTNFCQTATTTLTATGTGIANYQWYDGITPVGTDSFLNLNYTTPGIHTIILITDDGGACTDTLIETIYVSAAADAQWTSSNVSFVHTFVPNNTDGISWLWEFGDGGTSTDESPTHGYLTVGTYNVCLTLENACGTDKVCSDVFSSVDPLDISDLIQVFPNPATDRLEVVINHPEATLAAIQLYNVLGEPLETRYIPTATGYTVSLEDLPNGMYYVNVSMEKGRGMQKVLVFR